MKNHFVLLYLWAFLLITALLVTRNSFEIVPSEDYDEKVKAAELTKVAFDEIKLYKGELNIEISKDDYDSTGLIGDRYTPITTTMGTLESKRTSTNHNFAAAIIDMLVEGGVKKGDQVVVVFSGSFPALNIATMAAIEIMELKPYIMASLGSSSYGANNIKLTYLHMARRLKDKEIFTNFIDLVSLGGSNDIASEFDIEVKEELINYISSQNVDFLYEENYQKNIDYRVKKIKENVPNNKMLINVGGNLVSLGQNEESLYQKNGLIKQKNTFSVLTPSKDKGLIQRSLDKGTPVIQLLNIKNLAHKYQIPYDKRGDVEVGQGLAYVESKTNILIPILAVIFTISSMIYYKRYYKGKEVDIHA